MTDSNIEQIEVTNGEGITSQHIIIHHPDGSYTSMPKAAWDELEAAKENGTIS